MRIGRYETVGTIGTGGMGTVYLARALAAGGFERQVALKVMHPHLLSDRQFVEMFLGEARLAARILHPNVVATHDVQQLREGLFLVMDYVPGPSLHSILEALRRRDEDLPVGICLTIFLDALAGLHAAHELRDSDGQPLNIVHRDISPDNILISQDGIARLTDFGLARAQAQIGDTRGGQVKGKLAFLAPEVVLFGRVTRCSDIYAVGATLWEALTLRRLFTAENEGMLLAMVIEGARRTPQYENPKVPEPISSVCMQALQKNVDLRFQTADELAAALRDAARDAGVEPTPASGIAEWLQPIIERENLLQLVPERPSTRPFPMLAEEQAQSHGGTAVTAPGRPRSRTPLLVAVGSTVVVGAGVGAYLGSGTGAGVDAEQLAPHSARAPGSPLGPDTSEAAASARAVESTPKEAPPAASAKEARAEANAERKAEEDQDAGPKESQPDAPSAAPKPGAKTPRPAARPRPRPRSRPTPTPAPKAFDPDVL